jgi:glycosyltransferase involved in cell wall biosynthesis
MVPSSIPVRAYERPPEAGRRWRAALGLPDGAIVYVCVGRLEPQKNPIGLLNAFAAVDHPNAHLVMLGDGNLRGQVTERIRALGLSARVHLLGKRNDIPDCLAACDVFVLASHWEGNPLSVMEAMAAGLPVVSTAVGGVPELVANEREGILVPVNDENGLAAGMRLLAENRAWRATLGAAARERAKAEFDVDNMTRRYSALYRSLFDAARRGSLQRSTSWTEDNWAGSHSAQPAGGEES